MKVTASAIYYREGDYVAVEIYVTDPAQEIYIISQVSSAICKLVAVGQTGAAYELASIDFDLYYGNADGSFQVRFLHPARVRNLEAHITVTLQDASVLTVNRGVLIDNNVTTSLSSNVGGLNLDGTISPLANEDDI